jgi:peptide deformylase
VTATPIPFYNKIEVGQLLLKIYTDGDPILRKKAIKIEKITKRLRKMAKDMLDTMYEARGVGLAAPQIGVSESMVVIDVGEGPMILINPIIIAKEGELKEVEGCLSVPGRSEYICRAAKVRVKFTDINGKQHIIVAEEMLARAMQHEIDHLDGILFIDYLPKES